MVAQLILVNHKTKPLSDKFIQLLTLLPMFRMTNERKDKAGPHTRAKAKKLTLEIEKQFPIYKTRELMEEKE